MTLLFYPGYHKTGTTLVQTKILPHVGLSYFGKNYAGESLYDASISDKAMSILEGLALGRDCKNAFADFLVELAQAEQSYVLAAENFLRPASYDCFKDSLGLASAKFKQGDIGVLVSIRNLVDLFMSR